MVNSSAVNLELSATWLSQNVRLTEWIKLTLNGLQLEKKTTHIQ